MPATCRSCHAPILWVTTPSGKKMPLDPDPVDHADGSALFVYCGDNEVRPSTKGDRLSDAVEYASHFSTCPDAGQWREDKSPVVECPKCKHRFVGKPLPRKKKG